MLLRRLRLSSLLILCAAVIVTVLAMSGAIALELPHREPGPLRISGGGFGMAQGRLPAGAVHSSTVSWLFNAGDHPLVVNAWEPLGADGLDVVGVGLARADATGGFVGREEYPPVGPLPGGVHDLPFAVPPGDGSSTADDARRSGYILVVGVRRLEGHPYGHVAGIRLTYTVGDERLTLDVPIDLAVCEADCR